MVLLKDLIMGVFCNRVMYLERLKESIDRYFPNIPLIVIQHDGTILDGYVNLMDSFEKSGKRFFLWMDDDIVILNPEIIQNTLQVLVNGKYAAVIAHMTHNISALKSIYDPSSLTSHVESVLMGYFMIVDSWRVRGIKPDPNLPYPNISVETDYGMAIQASGYELGIVADYVYHEHKEDKNPYEGYLKTNEYLINKWGKDFYNYNVKYDGYLADIPLTKT
jgi:hypothetical protein